MHTNYTVSDVGQKQKQAKIHLYMYEHVYIEAYR